LSTHEQWYQVEVGIDVFIHLLYLINVNLDLVPLFMGTQHWEPWSRLG